MVVPVFAGINYSLAFWIGTWDWVQVAFTSRYFNLLISNYLYCYDILHRYGYTFAEFDTV